MSSFPEHEENIHKLKKLNIKIESIDINDDPYDTWNYDDLTYLTTELIEIINKLNNKDSK